MTDGIYDPAPYKDNIRALARYLAGQGYDAAQVVTMMARRAAINNWAAASVEAAARMAITWAQRFRDGLDYTSKSPIARSLSALNRDIPRAYRYGVLYQFADGGARTVLVHSDIGLTADQVIALSRDAWYERQRGSPTGRLTAYSPYNNRESSPQRIDSISIVTYERQTN